MTPQQEWKRVQRAIRNIPVDAIEPHIIAEESEMNGLWCLVDRGIEFIPADGGECVTQWDDPLQFAQYNRWLAAHPERVHESRASAVEYVRRAFNSGDKTSDPASRGA